MNTAMITNTAAEYRLKVGTSDFSKLVVESNLFIDKTLLIHDVIHDTNEVLLITRPRRWGKTLNMSMLQYFFGLNIRHDGSPDQALNEQKLGVLSQLKISAYPEKIEQYFGKYPVIFVSFKNINTESYDTVKEFVAKTIYNLYKTHEYLRDSTTLSKSDKFDLEKYLTTPFTTTMIVDGIKDLSQLLYKHFNQPVIILIDEYDKPLNDLYASRLMETEAGQDDKEYLRNILGLFRGIFGAALKDNIYLKKGIVTGILRIAKASLFSGVNNLEEYTIFNSNYSEHFGFTEEEVVDIVQRSGIDKTHELMQGVKEWYNGYNIGNNTIYNPWSIMKMIQARGNLESYWMGTADPGLIQSALVLDKFQEEVQTLIDGNTVSMIADPKMVFSDIQSSPNALHNLLLFSGYLTATIANKNTDGNSYTCEVRIPNNEVRSIYTNSISTWIQNKFQVTADNYVTFVKYLLSGNIDKFAEKLKGYLETSASYFDSGEDSGELLYNGFMLGILASSVNQSYFVEKERETGDGRADLLIIPKANAAYNLAFVLEYKIAAKCEDLLGTAARALEQIKSKNYVSKIKAHYNVTRAIGVGFAFCGKYVEIMYEDLAVKS